ncbi:TolC family protein [Limibacter armeniacum]|uniref:TolC family protein n=1 Tax=Limibacter armeniacum TaxID=466084 RepID=UPI002FE60AA6
MKKYLLILSVLLSNAMTYAQDVTSEVLSLKQAIQKGLENNYDIRIEESKVEDAVQQNSWGQAGRFPTIDFRSTFNNSQQYNKPASPFALPGTNMSDVLSGSVNANWVLFNGFKVNLTKEQLEKLEAQTEMQAAITLESTVEQIILAYYNVQLQQENLKVFKTILGLSKDRVEFARLQREMGSGSSFEVSQEETNFYNDSSNFVNQELVMANAFRDLNELMAEENLDKVYNLTDELSITPESFIFDDLLEKMKASNSTLLRQNRSLELSEINIRMQQVNRQPRLALDVGYNVSTNWFTADFPQTTPNTGNDIGNFLPPNIDPNDPINWGALPVLQEAFTSYQANSTTTELVRETRNGYSYGPYANLTLNVPIYAGSQRKRAVQSAKLSYQQQQLMTQKTTLSLTNQLKKTHEQYNNRIELVDLTEKSLQAAALNLRLSQEQYEMGTINSFDYRQVQNSYLNAAFRALRAKYDLIQSNASLLRMTGSIISDRE